MTTHNAEQRWQVVSLDLSRGMPELSCEPGYDGMRVVFFWKRIPLGHCQLASAQLPLDRSQVAAVAARSIATASGDYIFEEGFRSALPGSPPPPIEDPVATLDALLNVERPIARLAMNLPAVGPKPRQRLTVAVCTHERPQELERCLASIVSSSEPPEEILVIDNAPQTNDTFDVVARFPGVRYCYEPQPGLSVARNSAMAAAHCELIAFTDDDVVVHPDWTARLRRCFEDPTVMVVTGLVLPAELETQAQQIFENDFHFFHQGYRRRYFDSGYLTAARRRSVPVWEIGAGANMAIRRRSFDLGYRFDTRLGPGVFGGCGEDSEFWYQILADGWACLYEPSACVFHYHRRDVPALRNLVTQYMRGHVAALILQFRRYGHFANLRRLVWELPAEYVILFLRSITCGFPLDRRIMLRGWFGSLSGLRAIFFRGRSEIPAE